MFVVVSGGITNVLWARSIRAGLTSIGASIRPAPTSIGTSIRAATIRMATGVVTAMSIISAAII
jgi:hypothetical protein